MKVKISIIIICVIIALFLLSSQYSAWEESLSTNVSIQMRAKKKIVQPIIQPIIQSPVTNQTTPANNILPPPIDGTQQTNEGSGTGEIGENIGVPTQGNSEIQQEDLTTVTDIVELENGSTPQPDSGEQQADAAEGSGEAVTEEADTQEEVLETEDTDVHEEAAEIQGPNDGAQPENADADIAENVEMPSQEVSIPQPDNGERQPDTDESIGNAVDEAADTQVKSAETKEIDLKEKTEAESSETQ